MAGSKKDALSNLENLFGGGGAAKPVPTQSAEQRAAELERKVASISKRNATKAAAGPSQYRVRLEQIRAASDGKAFEEATNEFMKYHQLPDDLEILYRVLKHPDTTIVRKALGELTALVMQKRIPSPTLLREHLAQLKSDDANVKSYVEGILKALS